MMYGLIVSAIGSGCLALSLAEVCHVYPLSGGQYHWTYLLAPESYRRGLAYFTGWFAAAGWISLVGVASSILANFILSLILYWNPAFTPQNYQIFLLMIAVVTGAFLINAFGVRALPFLDSAAFIWGLAAIVIICITILATAGPNYQPARFVFATYINDTGWPNGVAFFLGTPWQLTCSWAM